MAAPIRLLVVDDHVLFRRGLVSLLNDFPEFKVVAEAANGQEGLAAVATHQPDLILLDLNMPGMDGLEMLHSLRNSGNNVRVLLLTISQEEEDLLEAVRAGADGYVLKNTDPEALHHALLQVSGGQGAISPEMIPYVLSAVKRQSAAPTPELVSEREIAVLECLSEGLTTVQIGVRLFISENTVKTHIRHILEKLEAANRVEAVAKAAQLGILTRGNP